jgi:hypothetical protein
MTSTNIKTNKNEIGHRMSTEPYRTYYINHYELRCELPFKDLCRNDYQKLMM